MLDNNPIQCVCVSNHIKYVHEALIVLTIWVIHQVYINKSQRVIQLKFALMYANTYENMHMNRYSIESIECVVDFVFL